MKRFDTHLVDFLNHGLLPFVGRAALLERVRTMSRATDDGAGLRAMLLLGEAGAGKSRMVEEIVRVVRRMNGVVLHLKLFPESSTSLLPIVARALARPAVDIPALQAEPGGSLASVMSALRRLVHLRQTLLVFEDIHLLNGDGIADFAALLDALGDEHVAVVCLARAGDLAARPVLERYLIEETDLPGLTHEELAELWEQLFGSPGDAEALDILARTTAGNPLALRSALRGALKAGAIARDGRGPVWQMVGSQAEFEHVLMRGVQMISEGLASHLDDAERTGAAQLAALGEILAPETAQAVLGIDMQTLQSLLFKGVLGETGAFATPITGTPASPFSSRNAPLAFTHTLLHRYLVHESTVPITRLAHAILENRPLYSIVPFRILAERCEELDGDTIDLPALAHAALAVARRLDATVDWRLAMDVVLAAERLLEQSIRSRSGATETGERSDEETMLLLEITAMHIRLGRRADSGPEYAELVERFEALTAANPEPRYADHRLQALSTKFWHLSRRGQAAEAAKAGAGVETLLAAHPHLRFGASHNMFLSRRAQAAQMGMDTDTLRTVQEELNTAREQGDAGIHTLRMVGPQLLLLFRTPEELAERLHILEYLEDSPSSNDHTGLRMMKMTLFMNIGYWRELAAISEESIAWFRDHGQTRSMSYARLLLLVTHGVFGRDLGTVAAEALNICMRAASRAPRIREHAASYFVILSLVMDEAEWGREITTALLAGAELQHELRGALAVRLDDSEMIAELASRHAELYPALFNMYRGISVDLDAALEETRTALGIPIVRISELINLELVLDLLSRPEARPVAEAMRQEIHEHCIAALNWLDQRGAGLLIAAFLRRYGTHLTRQERTTWQGRVQYHAEHAPLTFSSSRAGHVRLSMLDAIEIQQADAEPARPKGSRLRTLLGLMVADRMLERPLSHQEFLHLSAADAADPDDARKALNVTVFRLRELMGSTAILTDGATPRLNPDEVTVELLDAHRLLAEAERAGREGAGPRALEAITAALGIVRGRTPFPSLFDGFFQAMRDDFESRLRSTVLHIARQRLRESDIAAAEELLRFAHEMMASDTAVADLLREALTAGGKRAEAQRIGLKAEPAV